MSVGLDLSSSHFRSLRRVGEELVSRQCRAVYVVLKDTAGHRRLLEHAGVRFAECGSDLVLLGETAMEWADMLNLPVVSLLPNGQVPLNDPVARQLLALMVDAVLPLAETAEQKCCFTVPGGHDLTRAFRHYDVRFFQQLVALRGYTPSPISSSRSIVLAEMEQASFSGIGVAVGANCCEFSVVHLGQELGFVSTSGIGDSWTSVELGSLNSASSDESERLQAALLEVLTEAREALEQSGSILLLKQPVQVHCAGEFASLPGFLSFFTKAWQAAGWPVAANRIECSSQPAQSVVRGCLIQATLDSGAFESCAA